MELTLNACYFRSAFFWFCHDERTKVKALNPEYGVGDIAKELGRKWSDCDAEVKGKYEAMADKDKQRYERVNIKSYCCVTSINYLIGILIILGND